VPISVLRVVNNDSATASESDQLIMLGGPSFEPGVSAAVDVDGRLAEPGAEQVPRDRAWAYMWVSTPTTMRRRCR
jgi:hypothetical protein